MAKGIALCIGLNAVDPNHYSGWSGNLNACEADADDMMAIATSSNFKGKKLLTRAGTRKNVIAEITSAANALKKGDIFLLTYSGHGGQVPDTSGDEDDSQDETWCLYDGELIDDELNALFAKFAAGVRILMFSDSCHSGSVAREAYLRGTPMGKPHDAQGVAVKLRYMPREVALRTYRDNKKFYDDLQRPFAGKTSEAIPKASVLLISGCQDNQTSSDGTFNGLFTGKLLSVWNHGKFKGDYKEFHAAILQQMPPEQSPNFFWSGPDNPEFRKQKPFAV
jgi:metacaspase-1